MARKRRNPKGQDSGGKVSTPQVGAPTPAPGVGPLRKYLALGFAAALVLGAAWFYAARRPVLHRQSGLNILLVTIDTLRADALGAYGNTQVQTPWIDRLAEAGVRFQNCHAQNVVTFPSHTNILSGRYPTEHGVHDNANFRFPREMDSIATLLKAAGYRTGAFVSAFPLDARFGLNRGFDLYDDRVNDAEATHAFRMQERKGPETVAAALQWLGADRVAPSFAFVHLYEPHWPYEPPEPFASRYREKPYWGEVAAADAALGPLLEPILAQGSKGHTLVVLTADHGESLGEHGEMTHGIFAYEATLHVPLILYAPSILRPRVVEAPVRHVDILPTILDAIGRKAPGDLPGSSLLPGAVGQAAPETTSYFEALSASMNRGWAPLRGVVRGRRKFIELPIPELYDLSTDPGETRNLAGSDEGSLQVFRGLLVGLRKAEHTSKRVQEADEVRERLRGLGYVTSATSAEKAVYTVADDPKRLIPIEAELQGVLDRYSSGDLAGAIAMGEDFVSRHPHMILALSHLAFLYHEAGDLPAATAALRRAVGEDPANLDMVALLGNYLVEGRQAKEALQLVTPYAQRAEPDLDILVAQGMALADLGRAPEALAVFERCHALEPRNGMALVNIGTVHLMQGNREEAAKAFREAAGVDPSLARAHMNLGVVAIQEGHTDEAIDEWQKALKLDPRSYETLFDLGTLFIRLGRPQDARPLLERYVEAAPRATEARDIARVQNWLAHPPAPIGP
jgi:arylsulfatase A-like enzyme/tetratricopeptide (TPR) repeat protein